ncbi:MAG: aminotransferase class I/II-fold pyridoxal phosphate-dependent enzyme [Lachnospiraceae bacterium]|nr:aminotransferase class I/II-fold pyridoxal phosphate-dependent enzyme [Lachnospiraceae bacterium]
MIYFNCDYNEGAHEKVMQRLMETNREQTIGYGCDDYCEKARKLIREKCQAPEADVHFLVGGTQTNATVIAAALRTHQGVIAAQSGHINVHETGAIEADGHKVLALPSEDGKITAEQVEKCYVTHVSDGAFEHMVQPKMVYISQPTELGTQYTLAELEALSAVCRRNHLFLFVDGARLGYGLMAADNDVTMADLARLTDVFYIGGTKVGALFGEAVVISNPYLKEDFRYVMKQKGGMLAKGRLLGIQFLALFESDLYLEIAAHADKMADQIREVLYQKQIPFLVENSTNQIFAILPDEILDKLSEKYCFSYQERIDETHSAVRICTSWATEKESVDELCKDLAEIS